MTNGVTRGKSVTVEYKLAPVMIERINLICSTAIRFASGDCADGYSTIEYSEGLYSGRCYVWHDGRGTGVTYIPKTDDDQNIGLIRIERNWDKKLFEAELSNNVISKIRTIDFSWPWEKIFGLDFSKAGENGAVDVALRT